MPKLKHALCLLLVALLVQLSDEAQAARLRIYMRNQAYKGSSFEQGRSVWLPFESYTQGMRVHAAHVGAWYLIWDDQHPAGATPPSESATPALAVNGVPVPQALQMRGSAPYIAARPVTLALGGSYTPNPSLGMLDIMLKRMPSAAAVQQASQQHVATVSDMPVVVYYGASW